MDPAPESDLNNDDVIDLINATGTRSTATFLINKYKIKSPTNTLLKNLDKLHKTYQRLNKDSHRAAGSEKLHKFLYHTPYKCPASPSAVSVKSTTTPSPSSSFEKSVASQLAKEVNQCHEKIEKLQNINEKNVNLELTIGVENEQNEKRKADLKRTKGREEYWRQKCQKIDNDELHYTEEYVNMLKSKNKELEENNTTLLNKIKTLNKYISELEVDNLSANTNNDCDMVNIFDDVTKKYELPVHLCVYSLLDNHVSSEHVGPVIESVLKLVNKKPNKLPCASTVDSWSVERGILSKKHLSENSEKVNTTLHTDEASKYGCKWGAFATRDEKGNYSVLGLRDMATKSSHDTLETFKDILDDIENISENSKNNGKKILTNIKNTMSDRAATETKFNQLLETYRNEILPDVIVDYDTLDAEEKLVISHMNNFFCGLHTLVHMADAAQKSIYETEHSHFEGHIPIQNPAFIRSGQSGTARLIFTACKAFARRGDQKSGCHGSFKVFIKQFLKDNDLRALPLEPLRGNRFNILFSNAGHVYFLKDQMKDFLTKTGSMNGLLSSVLKDLQEPYFIGGCKALGLISKLITTPLW
ncbi:MAG: hypothetical protein ABW168_08870, partial [Sedimenticola sp.]